MSTPDDPSSEAPTYRTDPVPVLPEEPAPISLAQLRIADGAGRRVAGLPRALFLVPLVAVLVVVVAIVAGIVAATGGDDTATDSGPSGPSGDVLTADGYDELVAAVDDESGSTWVFDAVLYPAYAVVSIPDDGSSQRQESYYWDGSQLSSNDNKSTASGMRFNLTRVDGQVLDDLVQQVKQLVEDPTGWYAIVRAPDQDRAMIWAYASNEYDETAYLGARRDGTVVYDSTEH